MEFIPTTFEPDSLAAALQGADAIIHIAGVTRAKRRGEFFQGNVELTSRLLSAAALVPSLKRFCYVSSLTVVGPSPDGTPVDEDSPCVPITPYGQSKLEAERLCRKMSDRLPVVILRPPAVYGPRDGDILHMFRWIKIGLMPIMGPRNKTLSLLYVTELARALATVVEDDRAVGNTYFVGDEEQYRYSTLVEIAAELLQKKRLLQFRFPSALMYAIAAGTQAVSWLLPKPSVVNIDKVRDLVSPHWVCSPGRIKRELGFTTGVTAREGLQKTLAWYREQHWL